MGSSAEDRITLSQHDAASVLVEDLRGRMAEAADPARAPGMQAYMKSSMPFRGVSAVPLRAICREVLDRHRLDDRVTWEHAVRVLWDGAAYREERYAAIALTGHRLYLGFQDAATLDLYLHLVVTGGWWDLVDVVAANRVGPILRADPAAVTPVIHAWSRDEGLWVRRTAVLCQLRSKDDTDTALLDEVLTANLEGSPHGRDFFIRKAVGWALREYARTDPTWVRSFVDAHTSELSGLARREALKHVRAV
ncbi:MAG TPA: DNA alkylation repair protein [Nocardioidaceae bacterium]|nr:DNA alkylation repair protein [Nocardioidaceae bacterium]